MVKEKHLSIRINERFKERVQALAELDGKGVSEYVMDLLKQKVWEAEAAGLLPKSMKIN